MTTETKDVKRPNLERMAEIERKHFGRCFDQVWGAGRQTLIELLDYPKHGSGKRVMLIKTFEKPVPKSGSRGWPDLMSCYCFTEVDDPSNTWDGLDAALNLLETK